MYTPDEKKRDSYLRRTYGLSLQDYYYLLEQQGHRCPICLKHQQEVAKRFAVDHNHKTGECRGLLCGYCNRYVVGRHTDPDVIQRVADYLRQKTGFFAPPKKRKKRRVNARK